MKLSALVALLLALLLTGVIAAQVRTTQPEIKPTPGRYQIVMSDKVRADTFLLDTQTGRIWLRTTITDIDGQPDVWASQDRTDSREELFRWEQDKIKEAAIKQTFKDFEKLQKDAPKP